MPTARDEDIGYYREAINLGLHDFQLNTPLRLSHFIAQAAHESISLKYRSENPDYSAKALRLIFGACFNSDEMAGRYAHNPEGTANVIYANHMGNRGIVSGDGWRYRSRGLIPLKGYEQYRHCAKSTGLDCEANPDLLSNDPKAAVVAAGWYWYSHKLNELADKDDLSGITRQINGACHGIGCRLTFLKRAKKALKICAQE